MEHPDHDPATCVQHIGLAGRRHAGDQELHHLRVCVLHGHRWRVTSPADSRPGHLWFPALPFLPDFHLTRTDRHLCDLHDHRGRLPPHLEVSRTRLYRHEHLPGDRLFHQPGHRQQLHVRSPQTGNRQPAGRVALLALVHSMAGSYWYVDLLDAVCPLHDQGLEDEGPSHHLRGQFCIELY